MRKKLSLHKISLLAVFGIILPMLLIICFLFAYSLHLNAQHSLLLSRQNAAAIGHSISSTYDTVCKKTADATHSMNYLMFSNNTDRSIVYSRMRAFTEKLMPSIFSHDEVVAILLYHSANQTLFPNYRYRYHAALSESLQTLCSSVHVEHDSEDLILTVDDTPYLVHRITERYGTVLVILDPEQNALFRSYNQAAPDVFSQFSLSPHGSLLNGQLPFETDLDSKGILITAPAKNYRLFHEISLVQWVMLFILIAMMVFLALTMRVFRDTLLRPLTLLSHAFRTISSGDKNYRIQEDSPIEEVHTFFHGFNHMLDELHIKEEESNAHQFDAIRAKLQYLQLQIRPHFYLNCLKSIYSLSAMGENEKVQKLILDLSDYLRYTFRDVKNFVPLQSELEAVQSYIDLCSNIYTEIEIEYDLDADVTELVCLPLSILTFVENAIKHGPNRDGLKIELQIRTGAEQNRQYVFITIRNNGSAFSEEDLDQLNHADPSVMLYQRDHVGISNVRYRLWLIYGNEACLSFKNEENHAVVSVRYPLQTI